MRLMLALCVLVVVLCTGTSYAQESTKTPILTGEIWQKSSQEEKRAFFFGVDTVVAIDYSINKKLRERDENAQDQQHKGAQNQQRGKRHSVISPFERGWRKALRDVPRKEVIAQVDAWYETHPLELNKPVMRVVWEEIIKPRLDAR